MRQSSPTKAWIIEALNGIENAGLTEVADPVPAAGEVCCVSAMRTSGEPRALPITVRLIVDR